MDRASRRKKRQAKAKVQGEIEEGQNKLEIVLLEEIAEEWSKSFPSMPAKVIDALYLGISQGKIRAIVRFEVYSSWVNPDLSRETKSGLNWAIWRIDGGGDQEKIQQWAQKNEQEVRDYGTSSWVKLRYKGV